MNLNHLHLHVADVRRAAAFYETHFGLRQLAWHGDMVFMRDEAGMDLALAPADVVEPFPPWFHIGFRLESRAAVKSLFEAIRLAGAPIREPFADHGDIAYFRCDDPDGYQIEVYWEPPPAQSASAQPDPPKPLRRW